MSAAIVVGLLGLVCVIVSVIAMIVDRRTSHDAAVLVVLFGLLGAFMFFWAALLAPDPWDTAAFIAAAIVSFSTAVWGD